MKLRIYSDTHLDSYNLNNLWYPPELPDDKDTILILAGDIWIGTKFIEYAGNSWIANLSNRFSNVIIVLGNHDYWPYNDKFSILDGADKCRSMLQDRELFNVHILDASSIQIGDIVFIGATLWTDMNKSDPLAMMQMNSYMRYDGKITFSAQSGHSYFSSLKWISTHHFHVRKIKQLLTVNENTRCVVITHHLPLLQMGDPKYVGDFGNAYYMSDLSDLILDHTNIKLWCCGHSHCGQDFVFEHARMYMNPVGYYSEGFEAQGLVKHEAIDI